MKFNFVYILYCIATWLKKAAIYLTVARPGNLIQIIYHVSGIPKTDLDLV